MDDQDELKIQIKAWLKEHNKDYAWLADRCGVSKNTINNYLARKLIPASKVPQLKEIINSPIEAIEDIKVAPTKRVRRTRAQMREDLERDKAEAQEAGGYVDQEEADRKIKLMGVEASLDYIEECYKERESARDMSDFDMTNPENAECISEGQVFRIVVPNNILKIYREEAKWINKTSKSPLNKVTVAMLIAQSVTETAKTMVRWEEEEHRQLNEAMKLIEDRAKLKRNYSVLKELN